MIFSSEFGRALPNENTRINNKFLCCVFVFKMAGGPRDDTRAMRAGRRTPAAGLAHLSYFGFEKK